MRASSCILLSLLLGSAPSARAVDRMRDRPTLAVIVSVDGLSWPTLERYRPLYRFGLRRLLQEGRVETQCYYEHFNTETGPGHSALSTGAPPSKTGIVSNRWFEGDPLQGVTCDHSAQGDVREAPEGPNPGNLAVSSLGDCLADAWPGARVVSLSGKSRAAILLAGQKRSHIVYWYDEKQGIFRTSQAYRNDPTGPASRLAERLVARFDAGAGDTLWARLGRRPWVMTPHERLGGRAAPTPHDSIAAYQDTLLWGRGFPHRYADRGGKSAKDHKRFFKAVGNSPHVDSLLTELTLSFLADDSLRLGRGPQPDLLALSFSAQDLVSHLYGSESEENLDTLLRLDRDLGRLLDSLEAHLPRGSVVLALSADHGFSPIPRPSQRLVNDNWTDSTATFRARLNRILCQRLHASDPNAKPLFGRKSWNQGWNLFYDRSELARMRGPSERALSDRDVDAVLPRAVLDSFPQVRAVLLVSQRDEWPAHDPVVDLVRNDFYPGRSGDVVLLPQPGVLMSDLPRQGAGHGSQYAADRHVPLVFWGRGVRAGRSWRPTTPYCLAPALAARLRLQLPGERWRPCSVPLR